MATTSAELNPDQGIPAGFEAHCRTSIGHLQAALVELYSCIGADPAGPQEVSRRFKINKTLTWNISRVIQEADPMEALRHIPGILSFEKVLEAAKRNGANDATIRKVREAAQAFEEVVDIHVGDRATLELVLDSLPSARADTLERSRKMAFRGNSGLYGVQAKTRVMAGMLVPNHDDPSRLDMATVGGYVGFRRLRPNVRWPLFKLRSWSDESDNENMMSNIWEPLDPASDDGTGINLLNPNDRNLSDSVQTLTTDHGVDCVLNPGPIGNAGLFNIYRGEMCRSAVSRVRTIHTDTGEFGAVITVPVESLVLDVIAHKELDFALRPETLVFSRVFDHGERTGELDDQTLLPINCPVADIAGIPPAVATPLVPHYPQMIRQAQERMGYAPEDFRAVRLMLKYPPLGSTIVLRFSLLTE